jgi:putative colanic acid biosysnthesis UDP-glucose lipid carrier transferase
VTSLVAAFLEPGAHGGWCSWVSPGLFDEPIVRSDLTLCLLIFALTFPGRNRFWDRPLNAAVDISTSWLSLLAILAAVRLRHAQPGLFDPRC